MQTRFSGSCCNRVKCRPKLLETNKHHSFFSVYQHLKKVVCHTTGHEDADGVYRCRSTLSLTSAIDGVGDERHSSVVLLPGKKPGTHRTEGAAELPLIAAKWQWQTQCNVASFLKTPTKPDSARNAVKLYQHEHQWQRMRQTQHVTTSEKLHLPEHRLVFSYMNLCKKCLRYSVGKSACSSFYVSALSHLRLFWRLSLPITGHNS